MKDKMWGGILTKGSGGLLTSKWKSSLRDMDRVSSRKEEEHKRKKIMVNTIMVGTEFDNNR